MTSLRLPMNLLSLLATLAVTATACSSSVETAGTGGHGGGAGDGGAGDGGGNGGSGGGGGPVVCSSRVMDHAAACPTSPCAITEDVEITCDDWEYTAPGLRVAPAPDAVWLATASDRERLIYRIAGGSAVRTEQGLPLSYARRIFTLALGKDGAPHLATDATEIDGSTSPIGYPGGAEHAVFANGAWTTSLIYDRPDKYVPVVDLEIGADGAPRVWVVGDAPDTDLLATPAPSGSWSTVQAAAPAGGGGWRRFTLTADDRPAALDFSSASNDSAWQLRTLIDGVEAPIGDPVASYFPNSYAVTHAVAPAGAAAAGPSLAVAIQHDDALHVAWPTSPTYAELALGGSNVPVPVCNGSYNNGCPGPCHETSAGIEPDAFAIARTADGTIWVAFVRTQFDRQIHYEESCSPEPGCFCSATIDQENTTATLHLFRVATATATATEVLTMPVAPLQSFNLFSDLWTPVRWVDLRGFGSDLAIGVRTRTDVELASAAHVLRVDTTAFAPVP
jgi:hypothetical protein